MSTNPYQPPEADLSIPDTLSPKPRPELASRWRRLSAVLLNVAVLIVCLVLSTLVEVLYSQFVPYRAFDSSLVAILMPVWAICAGLLLQVVWIVRHGQTLGKYWLGIRVVRSDYSPCGLLRYILLREILMILLKAIPILGNLISLADILAIFRGSLRCLHDDLADTIVIREPQHA
ncbi:RDD family protein [Chitinilyticum litopenaei]|uniref:RDD family protein n=1 Tax=Chitinilyticum litopenaei TaxID=1121276 RepID=UPI0003FDDF3E|nr:RDD family protein [Chitinilyticum litopenaei]